MQFWGISPGSHVLEIGCGQGDTTVVLADAVGKEGHVDALDPGSLDYGSPSTLGQAQADIKSSPVGPQITFYTPMDPIEYLNSYTGPAYDHIVLSHCIYYFATPYSLPTLITALTPHSHHLCIAEWSLHPSLTHPTQSFPHILTALLCTHLESKREVESSGNIRTVLSPSQIKDAVKTSSGGKLQLEKEELMDAEGLRDAYWEVRDLLREGRREEELGELFKGKGEGGVVDERKGKEETVTEAMFDALKSSVDAIGGMEGVRCMAVWGGVFVVGEGK